MSLGYSPTAPDEQPRPWTLLEKMAAVIVAAAIIVGALTLVP
jgi:hypothetical protein